MNIKNKPYLIIGLDPQDYKIFDKRIMKPITYQLSFEEEKTEGSMVSQVIDDVTVSKKKLEYFVPNNVGILLSIAKKSTEQAKSYYYKHFVDVNQNDVSEDKIALIKKRSSEVCNYIELIQSSIVFTYTSLEAFSNLSIPENYFHIQQVKNKGIEEDIIKKQLKNG